MDWTERLKAAGDARVAAYREVGSPFDDVFAPMIGPALTGGPPWPSRPAWRVVDRGGAAMVTSDALSDPWEGADYGDIGHGMEVYGEAPAFSANDPALTSSWLFGMIYEVAMVVADHGGVRGLLDELGSISLEVDGRRFPAHMRTPAGRVGVLLHTRSDDVPDVIELPEGKVRWVAVTTLQLPELEHILEHGEGGRDELLREFAVRGLGHRSNTDRESLI